MKCGVIQKHDSEDESQRWCSGMLGSMRGSMRGGCVVLVSLADPRGARRGGVGGLVLLTPDALRKMERNQAPPFVYMCGTAKRG